MTGSNTESEAVAASSAAGEASESPAAPVSEALELRLSAEPLGPPSSEAWNRGSQVSSVPDSEPLELSPEASMRAGTLQVLLVARDAPFVRYLQALAHAIGMHLIVAADSATALAAVRAQPVDLALIDGDPSEGHSSSRVIAELRNCRQGQAFPVACLSSDDSVQVRTEAAQAGATLFFTKPIDRDQLSTLVDRLLERKSEERSRVLVLSEDIELSLALQNTLESEWEVTLLSQPARLFEELTTEQPELLLLDVVMSVSGFDVCRMLRAIPTWHALPVVFLVPDHDPLTPSACQEAGGDDYLVRPISAHELTARLKMRLARARFTAQHAHNDALTGLLTRSALEDALAKQIASARGRRGGASLALIELAQLQKVTLQYGRLARDQVLQGFAHLLAESYRSGEPAGRWRSHTLAVVLHDTAGSDAKAQLDALLRKFDNLRFYWNQEQSLPVNARYAIARYPEDGDSAKKLIACTEDRLVQSKTNSPPHAISERPVSTQPSATEPPDATRFPRFG